MILNKNDNEYSGGAFIKRPPMECENTTSSNFTQKSMPGRVAGNGPGRSIYTKTFELFEEHQLAKYIWVSTNLISFSRSKDEIKHPPGPLSPEFNVGGLPAFFIYDSGCGFDQH